MDFVVRDGIPDTNEYARVARFPWGRHIYRAWVTNLPLTPARTCRFHDGRAGMEPRIRELREGKSEYCRNFIFKHHLLERGCRRYAYRLTAKGVNVALVLLFFHKRPCGPLANSGFQYKPDPALRPNSKLEIAYHKADQAIDNIVDLLAAA